MSPRSRLPRTVAGILLTLAVAVTAAGCAKPSTGTDTAAGETGSGQVGEAPARGDDVAGTAPTPIQTPPVEEVPASPPSSGTRVILTLNPNLLLPWPSTPDCISYNPATAAIKYTASGPLWQITASGIALLAFKQEPDAQAGLALVKAYQKQCFIGRDNSRPDRARYIMEYWLDPVLPAPAIANPDCLPHNPGDLTVADLGTLGWRVQTSTELIALFDTKTDADNAVLVMKHYNRHCYIGRDYTGTDRLNYITNWFANA